MKPIENWRESWRLLTVQLAAAAVAFGSLPAETQAMLLGLFNIPSERVPAILGALVILVRLVKQGK